MSIKVTRMEIDAVKRQFIEDVLLFTPLETADMLKISVRKVFYLLDEGRLVAADRNGRATRVTAESIREYRKSIIK